MDPKAALQEFFDKEIMPRHRDWVEHVVRRREPAPFLGELQGKARAAGLWNLALPDRMSNRDFAPLAEIMGRLPWLPRSSTARRPTCPI